MTFRPSDTRRSYSPECVEGALSKIRGAGSRTRVSYTCVEGNIPLETSQDLTYFDGDLLCPECADSAGVER